MNNVKKVQKKDFTTHIVVTKKRSYIYIEKILDKTRKELKK